MIASVCSVPVGTKLIIASRLPANRSFIYAQTTWHFAKNAVRALEKAGFVIKRQSGHIVMSNGTIRLTIPRHNPINAITMGNIAKDAGLTPEEFRKLL